jgi:hypothetical protein
MINDPSDSGACLGLAPPAARSRRHQLATDLFTCAPIARVLEPPQAYSEGQMARDHAKHPNDVDVPDLVHRHLSQLRRMLRPNHSLHLGSFLGF